MTRTVGIAATAYLTLYIVASLATGQQAAWLGDLARVVPPLAFAGLALALARRGRGQVRIFWSLNAVPAGIWAISQGVALAYFHDAGAFAMSPAAIFLLGIPLAAALYGRPDRDRSRLLFGIVALDIVLIALFLAFVHGYFVVLVDAANGSYSSSLPLFHARNLLLALWAGLVWRTASPAWRRVLGVYALGLAAAFVGGVIDDAATNAGPILGLIQDLSSMAPYVAMAVAAAISYDEQLFEPIEEPNRIWRFPVVSLIATILLVAIPVIDLVARRMSAVALGTEVLRTRLALALVIPFGVALVAREWLSRRAVLNAGRQLDAARDQLERTERLAAVGQLVSGVAHELNNPLQGVLGYAELLIAGRNSPIESEELKAILENANRAASIVRNLLTFAGRGASGRGWQQMNQIVHDAAAARESHLQAAGTDIRLELADRMPLVYIDKTRLTDVLINLIQNAEAAIATRRDGETPRSLKSPPSRGEVIVTTNWHPDRIVVEVGDNGTGLNEEDLSRVFDPFFTTRATGQVTGLGLSVCYGILREHGGTVTARNRATGGTIFTIELPVTAESLTSESVSVAAATYTPRPSGVRPPAAALASIPPRQGDIDQTRRRRTALVVDDEESNAALVRRMLDGAGYDVESTTLSRRALVMIERTAYDAVICDVKMPELGGQELYGRVCKIRPEMSRRFIFITGDIDGEDTREFLDQSHCSYFMKPFKLERLTAAVDTITGPRPPDTIG